MSAHNSTLSHSILMSMCVRSTMCVMCGIYRVCCLHSAWQVHYISHAMMYGCRLCFVLCVLFVSCVVFVFCILCMLHVSLCVLCVLCTVCSAFFLHVRRVSHEFAVTLQAMVTMAYLWECMEMVVMKEISSHLAQTPYPFTQHHAYIRTCTLPHFLTHTFTLTNSSIHTYATLPNHTPSHIPFIHSQHIHNLMSSQYPQAPLTQGL